MFKVGDRVKVVPTVKKDWNSKGRMEASVGLVGIVVSTLCDVAFNVDFGASGCDTDGERTCWTYCAEDLKIVGTFKGNKHATAS